MIKQPYFFNHEDKREAIAEAGWKKATSEHTNLIRLTNIFQKVENDVKNLSFSEAFFVNAFLKGLKKALPKKYYTLSTIKKTCDVVKDIKEDLK